MQKYIVYITVSDKINRIKNCQNKHDQIQRANDNEDFIIYKFVDIC